MKTSRDPRHQKRIRAVQDLFAWSFREDQKPPQGIGQVTGSLDRIDGEISEAAPEWPKNQINKIDLAILRLAVFELIIEKGTPFRVVVDEAVELAKEFGTEASPGFVNGVLGNIVSRNKLE